MPDAYPAEARSPRWKCVNGSQASSSMPSMNASTDPDPPSIIATKPIATTNLHEPRMIRPPEAGDGGPTLPPSSGSEGQLSESTQQMSQSLSESREPRRRSVDGEWPP